MLGAVGDLISVEIRMRKNLILFISLVAMLMIAACAENAEPTLSPAVTPAGQEAPSAGEEARGTPQLIEFYADW
jgi:hypothetical protein